LAGKFWLRWLNTYSYDFKTFSDESWFDPNTGALIDYWGTPLSLVVKTPEEYTLKAEKNEHREFFAGDNVVSCPLGDMLAPKGAALT